MGKGKELKKAKDEWRDSKNAPKGDGKKVKRSKKVKPKPRGMRWISPYLTVKDVDRSLAWYEKAFGFRTLFSMPGPDGKPMHAEMGHEKSVVMIGPETPEGRSRAPGKDGAGVSMYIFCRDVDAIAASASAAGATIAEAPADQFWGDRTCFLIDPDGHQWMFATHVFDMDPDAGACPESECGACSPEECPDDKAASAVGEPAVAVAKTEPKAAPAKA
jgi:PhnB protein